MADEGLLCGCAICGASHLYGVDVDKPAANPSDFFKAKYGGFLEGLPVHSAADYRIEALRAASRVAAGIHAGGGAKYLSRTDKKDFDIEDPVLAIAEQFALWLEDGKR